MYVSWLYLIYLYKINYITFVTPLSLVYRYRNCIYIIKVFCSSAESKKDEHVLAFIFVILVWINRRVVIVRKS